ncbi:response regulator transcription factor [Vagococcus elongatus]|uniref:DNA-binding response regulator n=1 Tax=Vagococcus elongatus TaxID=180344 RepID=A0A430B5R4_9ENTE|nr:response regulator transcription factor [Vagococcus elongatus]RSU15652.1 DNA-binding response regulator [Vagococcus elongatus]
MKRVLIVDDEPSITTLLQYHFEKEGYEVVVAHDGEKAVEEGTTNDFYFIILDVMLPKLDGFEIVKILRQKNINTPILMLTAKDDVVDKIVGLEIGADDYMTKPFSPRELIARMKTIMRRVDTEKSTPEETQEKKEEKVLKVGDLVAYPGKFIVEKKGSPIELTRKEFELLVYFMARKERIIDRETLLAQVWSDDYFYDQSRTVDIHVSHLREKIEDNPKKPKYLKTVRGFGYKFQEPEK